MKTHMFTTGTVRLTQSWMQGHGGSTGRLIRAITDHTVTDQLPVWCYLIEHPDGLILIDTGIPHNANAPVWFPPYMRLVQRAAPFQIAGPDDEIGPQLQQCGFSPDDVRWVVLTHLHQDHEGGLHHFPNATFIVAEAEWKAATGIKGRMAGYLNHRWPTDFAPTLINFEEPDEIFAGRYTLTRGGDVVLVPTPGHTAGHLSVIVQDNDTTLFFAGDASYSESLLLADALDGVSPDARAAHDTHRRIIQYAQQHPTIYLPSHEWEARERLQNRQVVPATDAVQLIDD